MLPHDALDDIPVRRITAGIATAARIGDYEGADRLRAVLRTTKLAAKIREAVDAAPPLTSEQIEKLRSLLPLPVQDEAA